MPSQFQFALLWTNALERYDRQLRLQPEGSILSSVGGPDEVGPPPSLREELEEGSLEEERKAASPTMGSVLESQDSSSALGPPVKRLSTRLSSSLQRLRGTFFTSTLILLNSMLGTSVLAIPWALSQTGWALGVVNLAFAGLLTYFGAAILLWCNGLLGRDPSERIGLADIAGKATPGFRLLPELLIVLNCLGSGVGVMVILGDLIPDVITRTALLVHDTRALSDPLLLNRKLWISVVLALVSPLCLSRSITSLRFSGVTAALAIVFVTAVTAVVFFTPSLQGCGEPPGTRVSVPSSCSESVLYVAPPDRVFSSLLTTLPIFFYAYCVNFQIYPVYNDLRVRRQAVMERSVASSLTLAFLAYSTIGLLAYWTYGALLGPNFLRVYTNIIPVDVARIGIAVVVAMLFPVVVFTARGALITLLSALPSSLLPSMLLRPGRLFYAVTGFCVAFCYIGGLFSNNLSKVFGVVGAVATTPVTLTLPGLYYARLHRQKQGRLTGPELVGWGTVGLGVAISALALYTTFG